MGIGLDLDRADLISPAVVVELLSFMHKSPHFQYLHNALPILGVDGSLAHFAGPDNAARGKVFAKTGTLIFGNLLNNRPIMIAKGLAGYISTAKVAKEIERRIQTREKSDKTISFRTCKLLWQFSY